MSRLFLILGDQLHPDPHPLLVDFDPAQDRLLMVEAGEESTHVWSYKARCALFLAAMRHRAAAFRDAGLSLDYLRLGEHEHSGLADAVGARLAEGGFRAVVMLEVGDYRVQESQRAACESRRTPLLIRPDPHFLCSLDEFNPWAGDKVQLRLEFFYRWQRQRHRILMVIRSRSAASGISMRTIVSLSAGRGLASCRRRYAFRRTTSRRGRLPMSKDISPTTPAKPSISPGR